MRRPPESEHSESIEGRDFVTFEGIRIYGKVFGFVEPKDLVDLTAPRESLLHIVRHMSSLSPDARARLLSMGASESQLNELLSTLGSKFNSKINNPNMLIDLAREQLEVALRKEKKIFWLENSATREQRAYLQKKVTPEQKEGLGISKSEYLGTKGVMPITKETQPLVIQEQRGQADTEDVLTVNVIQDTPSTTDDLVTVIKRLEPGRPPQIHTVYSGVIAPNLPNRKTQLQEEFAYNKNFWDTHAFMK